MNAEMIQVKVGCGTQIARDAAENGYMPVVIKSGNGMTAYDCNGVRAIDTNGDVIWEEADPAGYAEAFAQI